jgi:hypothetical protein
LALSYSNRISISCTSFTNEKINFNRFCPSQAKSHLLEFELCKLPRHGSTAPRRLNVLKLALSCCIDLPMGVGVESLGVELNVREGLLPLQLQHG